MTEKNIDHEGFEQFAHEDYEYVFPKQYYLTFSPNRNIFQKRNKLTFKPPLTIYQNIEMTSVPSNFSQFEVGPQINRQKSQAPLSIESSPSKSSNSSPLKNSLLCQHGKVSIITTKYQVRFSKELNKQEEIPNYRGNGLNIEPPQWILSKNSALTEQAKPEKLSDIFPKRFLCMYNKFQQNVVLKSDMTIMVRNVTKSVKLELLKPIPCCYASDFSLKKNKASQKQLSHSQRLKRMINHETDTTQKLEAICYPKEINLRNKSELYNGNQIEFYSNFQSGNLHLVYRDRANPDLFYLFLTNDLNTHGYNQWFFFGVRTSLRKKYRFIIMNISKDFRYQQQMKILALNQESVNRNIDFAYYKNKFCRYNGGYLSSVDFEYETPVESDPSSSSNSSSKSIRQQRQDFSQPKETYFCLSYPYTFSKLMGFLKEIKQKAYTKLNVYIQSVGLSEAQNHIPVVRVQLKRKAEKVPKVKKAIFVMARQHAGETPASFVCEQIIRILTDQENETSINLLKSYVFHFVPMANPDGVIHGHSRTNLKGYDINRMWEIGKFGVSQQTAETFAINKYISLISRDHEIQYTVDLHSHSRQLGAFAYFSEKGQTSKYLTYFLCQGCPQFRYSKCQVSLSHQKRCTFRGQMYHRLRVRNSITIETSFYGYKENYQKNSPLIAFTLKNYRNIAEKILKSFLEYNQLKNRFDVIRNVKANIEKLDHLARVERTMEINQNKSNESDSDPENEYLDRQQRQMAGDNTSALKKNSEQEKISRDRKCSYDQPRAKSSQAVKTPLQSLKKAQNSCSSKRELLNFSQTASQIFRKEQKIRRKIYSDNQKSAHERQTNNWQRLNVEVRQKNRMVNEVKHHEINRQQSKGHVSEPQIATQQQLDFRRKIRQSYRTSSNCSSFVEKYAKFKEYQQQKQAEDWKFQEEGCDEKSSDLTQSKSFVVYPTAANLALQSKSIKVMHQNLMRTTLKVKNTRNTRSLRDQNGASEASNRELAQHNQNRTFYEGKLRKNPQTMHCILGNRIKKINI